MHHHIILCCKRLGGMNYLKSNLDEYSVKKIKLGKCQSFLQYTLLFTVFKLKHFSLYLITIMNKQDIFCVNCVVQNNGKGNI